MSSILLKGLLVCLVIAASSCMVWSATENQAALEAWESFIKTYQKTYASEEEYQLRKEQFIKNYEALTSQNKKQTLNGQTYKTGVTKFSDLSSDEFLKKYTGVVVPTAKRTTLNQTDQPIVQSQKLVGAAANLDWRTAANILTSVRDQGSCGSCWAFATIASLEAAYNKKKGSLAGSFSEQHLVDCDSANLGCDGGWPTYAFDYLKSKGAATATGYPYKGYKSTCKSSLASKTYNTFTRTYRTNVNDATLRDLLSTYGPLVVLIDATPLQSYTGGIINKACSSINHAVNLVGYVTSGTGAPYYILRNSWGSNWGESGYFRVSASNSCFIKKYVWGVSY